MTGRGWRRRGPWNVLLVCLAVTCFACSSDGDEGTPGSPAPETTPPADEVRGVRVVRVEARELEDALEVTGEVLARSVVDVAPLGSGRLEGLRVDEGDRLTRDATIATLDDDTEAARRRELEAQLQSARARARTARANVTEHERELERRRELVARGALGVAEVERWEDQLPRLRNEVDVLDAAVDEIRSTQRTATLDQRRREVRSPIDGLVVTRHVVDGAMVSPQTPIVTVVDEASIEWRVRVHEQRLGRLRMGGRARARLDANPDEVLPGEIVRIGSIVDREARSVEVGIRLTAEPGTLRHGMFARGELILDHAEVLPSVPVEALAERETGASLLVVVDDVVERRSVEVIFRTRRFAAVQGVQVGDAVIVRAPTGLSEGDRVVIVGETIDDGRDSG